MVDRSTELEQTHKKYKKKSKALPIITYHIYLPTRFEYLKYHRKRKRPTETFKPVHLKGFFVLLLISLMLNQSISSFNLISSIFR